ncbi:hypothetical protein G9A89_009416 [Geosiphon pyriformis]|nr:hypothetical protein G9A89_009416 [Geosiphon pyriformis]
MSEQEFSTVIQEVPVTWQRPVPQGLEKVLGNAGTPRATIAASRERPHGTPGRKISHRTVLQQHVDFFDEDNDGIIRIFDTYRGFRSLGFNFPFCLFAAFVIHGSMAWVSQPYWFPNPLLYIYTENINKCKHGSDSETYDTEGRYVPEKFEEIFTKYDRDNKGGLSIWDIGRLCYGNGNVLDIFGWLAMIFEWGTTYFLAQKDGILYKEDVRAQYDLKNVGKRHERGIIHQEILETLMEMEMMATAMPNKRDLVITVCILQTQVAIKIYWNSGVSFRHGSGYTMDESQAFKYYQGLADEGLANKG